MHIGLFNKEFISVHDIPPLWKWHISLSTNIDNAVHSGNSVNANLTLLF